MFDDLRDRLVARLKHDGFQVPGEARTSVRDAVVASMRVRHRSITPRPRPVRWSKELLAKQMIMSAPSLAALMVVIADFEGGQDVNQRLTRRHFKAGFNDRLRNDLGVHHVHVGPRGAALDKTGKHLMSGGADELLWAVVRDDSVYLIELLPHSAVDTFDFAGVIYKNWPALLGPPLEGVSVDEADGLAAESRAKLRRVGLFSIVAIDGKAFMPGGFAKDGTSIEVVRRAN